MAKILYKPLGSLIAVLGGLIATRLFNLAWRAFGHHGTAPKSMDADRSWGEVLVAATLRGAVFGLVSAITDRGGAIGFSKATGVWPGDE